MASKSVFGEIPGFPEGATFASREELRTAGLHRHTTAGISGSSQDGADAIVLSGGYEDNQDFGNVIVYTGEGGNRGGHHFADQKFTKGNKSLAISQTRGFPVRVIRGYKHKSELAPKIGYRYDGLYIVDDFWCEVGSAGYLIWRFRLHKALPSTELGLLKNPTGAGLGNASDRYDVISSRIIRDTKITRWIKRLYRFQCQVCRVRLIGPAGPYAEGAHIRPLGMPHNGPDIISNMICLCPNHHALFDLGGFSIDDEFRLLGIPGRLNVSTKHSVGTEFLRYHREHYWENR